MDTLKLKFKRLEKGYSQKFTAKHLGIAEKTYCLKEGGKSEFDRNEISKLIQLLELSVRDVMDIFFNNEVTNSQFFVIQGACK